MTKQMLQAVVETIQLESGIGTPIMEDMRPLDYIEWGWITGIRDFLQHKKKVETTNLRPISSSNVGGRPRRCS
jgi:hypothetical protein